MNIFESLLQRTLEVQNERNPQANTAYRIGSLLKSMLDYIHETGISEIRMDAVDTYEQLDSVYPDALPGYTVLVRTDTRNNHGKPTLYKWNGEKWVDLETTGYATTGALSQVETSILAMLQSLEQHTFRKNSLSDGDIPYYDESNHAFSGSGLTHADLEEVRGMKDRVPVEVDSAEFSFLILDSVNRMLMGFTPEGEPFFPKKEMLDRTENPEFLYVKTDREGRILFGIAPNGAPVFPGTHLLESQENPEYAYTVLDQTGKLLFGIRKDSSLHLPGKQVLDQSSSSEYIHLLQDETQKILFGIHKDGTIHTPLNPQAGVSDSQEFLYTITDSEACVLYGIRRDGTVYYACGNPSDTSAESAHGNYYTESPSLQIALPTSVARVDVDVQLSQLTTAKNDVHCTLEYRDHTGVYFRKPATIAYQGSSSMSFIKKNFSIELFNDESRTENCKIKFGDWVPQDSFHLKAYYIDSMLARDPVCNRLWHQMIESRPYEHRYPYQVPYHYGWEGQQVPDHTHTLDQRFLSSGARCHVDGFPIEIYIQGQYWGLYVWRLKKHRDNYRMEKSNQKNILMELSGRTYMQLYKTIIYPSVEAMNSVTPESDEGCFVDNGDGTFDLYYSPYSTTTHIWRKLGTKTAAQMEVIHTDEELPYTMEVKWERLEVRNPKIDAIWQKGDEFEPVESQAKRSIYSFLEWCSKYTPTTITREEIETRLNVSFCIDFYLFCEFVHAWDLRVKNTLYGTYDGVIWQPFPYDLDCVFGSSASGKFRGDNPHTVTTNTQIPIQFVQARYGDEFKARYAELRNCGIFTVENVIGLFLTFTNQIGTDLYRKNLDRWPDIPSENEGAFFSMGQIAEWVKARISYMDTNYLK